MSSTPGPVCLSGFLDLLASVSGQVLDLDRHRPSSTAFPLEPFNVPAKVPGRVVDVGDRRCSANGISVSDGVVREGNLVGHLRAAAQCQKELDAVGNHQRPDRDFELGFLDANKAGRKDKQPDLA